LKAEALAYLEDEIISPSSLLDAMYGLELFCSAVASESRETEASRIIKEAFPQIAELLVERIVRFEELCSLLWYDDGGETEEDLLAEANELRDEIWKALSKL
jgi:hypothetical protein